MSLSSCPRIVILSDDTTTTTATTTTNSTIAVDSNKKKEEEEKDDTKKSCARNVEEILFHTFHIKHILHLPIINQIQVRRDWFLSLLQQYTLQATATSTTSSWTMFVILVSNNTGVATANEISNLIESETPFASFIHSYSTPSSSSSKQDDATTIAMKIIRLLASSSSSSSSFLRKKLIEYQQKERQQTLIQTISLRTSSMYYLHKIASSYDTNTQITGSTIQSHIKQLLLPSSTTITPIRGKVRDTYELSNNRMALITTDRQSGFDRILAMVPYKGRVLNLISAYWFEQTSNIVPNHLLHIPHPNVSIVKKCKPFPIEFVVRAYMTGSTSTSIWTNYKNGIRNYCGHTLPPNMKKNQKIPNGPILTPTTKEKDHDRPISSSDIIKEGFMTKEDFDQCSNIVLSLFAIGQKVALERGLILVDTKYELGIDLTTSPPSSTTNNNNNNNQRIITLIDEIHTPDSSRYWLAHSYKDRISQNLEPENIDKEFLRLWFKNESGFDPYNMDISLPKAPKDLVLELSRRYIQLYEMISWKEFPFTDNDNDEEDDEDDEDEEEEDEEEEGGGEKDGESKEKNNNKKEMVIASVLSKYI